MNNEDLNKDLNKVKSEIANLREDMASLLQAMKDAGVEQGHEYYDRASKRARQTGESIRDRASEAYSTIDRVVEERPLTSVLTAFATGFIVSMFMDRRH